MNKKPDKPDPLRASAEAELAYLRVKASQARPAEELLHELQVYKIELEMQNEQLREAQTALEESRDRYVELYEFAPIGYLTLTREGTISEVNLTGANLLGVERKKLLHRSFSTFVAPEQKGRWNRLFADSLQCSEANSSDLIFAKADGKIFYAHVDCLCRVTNGGTPEVRVALTDITHLREAEEAMREWQAFVECAPWGMSVGDIESRTIRLVNLAYSRMHGYTVEELRNIKADALYAPESLASLPYYVECARKDGQYSFECMRLRKDGSKFAAKVDISIVDGVDGKTTAMVSVKDITERKVSERHMRDLTAHIQTIREEEKANIAREIHDDLGGTLTALKMEVYWLAEELSASKDAEPFLRHVELMSQLTENAVNVTRRVITGLRPTVLDDLGLLAAIEWQADQFYKHTGIACRVNSLKDNSKLDRQYSIALFRIFQEALTNVARHSGATRVEVEFSCDDEEIMLSVSDDGRGLPDGHSISPTSYGVRGMCERVEQLGGKIKFDSPLGGGFNLTATLPLPEKN